VTPEEQSIDTPSGEHSEEAPPGEEAAPIGVAQSEGAAAALGDSAATEEEALEQLRERASRADEYLALAQRTQADFENFRKRMTRDLRAAETRATGRLAKELLPAFDNLERVIVAVECDEDEQHHLTQGIRLVQAELASALSRSGIEGFVPAGERFDPAEHDAVAQRPIEGAEPGTVVEVLQPGYRLNGAILRPARVIVAG
jgi:molecular chaperone GrpE